MDWWNALTDLQKIFASIAIPATLFMVIQFILLLFGLAHDSDADGVDAHTDLDVQDGSSHDIFDGHSHDIADGHDHDGTQHHTGEGHDKADTLRLFTVRSIIAFLSVGGWMGVAAIDWNLSAAVSIVLALAAGWLALFFVAWMIRAFLRMQQSGNVLLENAVGREGEVYIPIPQNGLGKVNVIVQDRLCEITATSKSDRVLKTGEKITVLGVAAEGVLLVAPKSSPEGLISNQSFRRS